MEYLQYNESCQHDCCIAVYTGALDQMILALGIIQMSNIAQFEERKLLENN